MPRYRLDNLQLEALRDISDDVIEADFVPYACLWSPDTLLTKNGEVLQVIKVTGFNFEDVSAEEVDLRKIVRTAIAEAIDSSEYAVWLHTLRRKKRLTPDGNYPDAFSDNLNQAWVARNDWERKFTNELYITIVREGQSAAIASAGSFFRSLLYYREQSSRMAYIEEACAKLTQVTDRVLARMAEFGARKLSIVERDGEFYGEHLEFLERLINLEERPIALAEMDLSEQLTSGEITFAYNAMEVRTKAGLRRFAAVLTVKEYKEASLYSLDEFLQVSCEFIVTQSMNFVNARAALAAYKDQQYYLRVSGDAAFAEKSELNKMLQYNQGRVTDFGEQQTQIFVIGYTLKELESSIKLIRDRLAQVGIVTIREDLKMEECYWAQLPANFEFLKRLLYTNTHHVGGFLNIQNYPAGNSQGSHWGSPVSIFYTAAGTPYFFNFHLGEVGHTLLVGPAGSGKSGLLHFLLAQARKYQNRLLYLDAHGKAAPFIEAIGGAYTASIQGSDAGGFAPFSLPDSKPNREFLKLWLSALLEADGKGADYAVNANQLLDYLYTLPANDRHLSSLKSYAEGKDALLAQHLSRWCRGGIYGGFFDHAEESARPQQGILGINLSSVMDKPDILAPIAAYLLHRMTMALDGTPTIFVLNEAWKLLNNPFFAPRLSAWLNYITSKNALVIFTTEDVESCADCAFSQEIVSTAVTQIYLPNDDPSDAYEEVFHLSDDEFNTLDAMNVAYRHFMLKRGRETIIAELNLGGMDDILAVLTGRNEGAAEMKESA